MCDVCRVTLAACLTVALAAPLAARPEDDAKVRPASPRTRAEELYKEALKQYAVGLQLQREDRLVTATRTLEQAVRLDPEAIHPRVELIDLYVALGRPDDAAKTAAAVVSMAPAWEDEKHKAGKIWLVLARLRQDLGQTDEAVATLWQCVKHPALKEHPAAQAAAACDIGRLLEGTHAEASVTAYRLAVTLYGTLAAGAVPPAEIAEAAEGMGRAALKYSRDSKVNATDKAKLYADAEAAFREAQKAFTKAGDVDRAARIDYHLATVAIARKNWRAADGLLKSYLARKPRDADAYALYARVLRENRDSDAAIAMLQVAARDLPDFMPVKLLLAEAYGGYRTDLAEQMYRQVMEKAPDVAAARGLITHLARTGGTGRVLNELERAFQEAMPDGRTVTNEKAAERARAMISALRQEPGIVRELLNDAVKDLNGGWPRGFGGRGRGFRGQQPPPQPFDKLVVLGELAESTRQLDFAEQLFQAQVVDLNQGGGRWGRGRNGMINPATLDAYLGLIRVLRAGHKHEEVVQVCRRGLEREDAMTPYLNYFMAASLMRLGRGDQALAAAEQAIQGLNDDVLRLGTRLLRLEILAFLGRFDQAIADGRKLLDSEDFTSSEDIKRIRLALANVYSEARRCEPAESLLRAALELAPNDATLHNALAYHLAEQGRKLDEAERLIRRALELDQVEKRRKKEMLAAEEENAAFLDTLGWVLFRKGRLTEARDWLKKACDLPEGESDAVVWDHRGDVYARLGSTFDAKAAWERARKLYTDERRSQDDARGAEVRRKLERLKKQ
jgi:tetratricopeptide (TPR) repeat protein